MTGNLPEKKEIHCFKNTFSGNYFCDVSGSNPLPIFKLSIKDIKVKAPIITLLVKDEHLKEKKKGRVELQKIGTNV